MHAMAVMLGLKHILPGIGIAVVTFSFVWLMSRFVLRKFGPIATVAFLMIFSFVCSGVVEVHSWITGVEHSISHPSHLPITARSQSHNGFATELPSPATSPFKLTQSLSQAHANPWVISLLVVGTALAGLIYLIARSLPERSRALFLYRLHTLSLKEEHGLRSGVGQFPLVGIEVGVDKKSGRAIRIEGKDRFINTLVVGSIGTGKTSRILSKGAYQDLRHISSGAPMDLIVMDPDGGLVGSVLRAAHRFRVEASVIDLRGEIESNISLNPFAGGDISDIVDNVRAVLREQMGDQDGFFQAAQDDLVRTVIQVQVPIWPETDFLRFSELVTDPMHFRAVCHMIYEHAMERAQTGKGRKRDQLSAVEAAWASERLYIEQRYDEMNVHTRSMVLSAARSFLMDTRSEQKLEHLEKITKGLKIVVSELSTHERLRQVLGKSHLTPLDFPLFFASGPDVPGRLITIVTGNRPTGNLFGKLFLVTLKMHALARAGDENTRRPLYCYIDEFPRFATSSLSDLFAQGRKYRVGLTMAIQTRAQLQLASNKGFVDVVEGSCRNKIYFPAPAPADARYLQEALGTVKMAKRSYSENILEWYLLENRRVDRKVTTREDIDPRFRIEDLLFSLEQDEAVYLMTVDNQARHPMVGYTSYADEWVQDRKQFFHVSKPLPESSSAPTGQRSPELPIQMNAQTTAQLDGGSPFTASFAKEETTSTNETPVNPDVTVPFMPVSPGEAGAPRYNEFSVELTAPTVSDESSVNSRLDNDVPPKMAGGEETSDSREDAKVLAFQRVDLRTKISVDKPVSVRPPKPCPKCENGILKVTPDGRKWRCSKCGFERKNRTQ